MRGELEYNRLLSPIFSNLLINLLIITYRNSAVPVLQFGVHLVHERLLHLALTSGFGSFRLLLILELLLESLQRHFLRLPTRGVVNGSSEEGQINKRSTNGSLANKFETNDQWKINE